jgi:hypothetical protein
MYDFQSERWNEFELSNAKLPATTSQSTSNPSKSNSLPLDLPGNPRVTPCQNISERFKGKKVAGFSSTPTGWF